jgi:hypothetical protein
LKKDLAAVKSGKPGVVMSAEPAASDFDWDSFKELMRNMQNSKEKLLSDLAVAAINTEDSTTVAH